MKSVEKGDGEVSVEPVVQVVGDNVSRDLSVVLAGVDEAECSKCQLLVLLRLVEITTPETSQNWESTKESETTRKTEPNSTRKAKADSTPEIEPNSTEIIVNASP